MIAGLCPDLFGKENIKNRLKPLINVLRWPSSWRLITKQRPLTPFLFSVGLIPCISGKFPRNSLTLKPAGKSHLRNAPGGIQKERDTALQPVTVQKFQRCLIDKLLKQAAALISADVSGPAMS